VSIWDGRGRSTASVPLAVLIILSGSLLGQTPSAAADRRQVLDKYCVSCHNQRLQTAGLQLEAVDVEHVGGNAAVWEKVVRKLRSGAMPPPGLPRPDQATYDTLASQLESALDHAAAAGPNPGRTDPLHRLTRAEYQNAIRDLLDLDLDVAPLVPADTSDRNGFDNMEGVLSVSPALLQRYVSAAHKISRLALGIAPSGPTVDTYMIPITASQDDQMSEDLPFGSRGGIAIHHLFPVDGEYELKIHLQTNYVGFIRGLLSSHQLEIRLDGQRLNTFQMGGHAPGKEAPASYEGNIFGSTEWENYMRGADSGMKVRLPVHAGPRLIQVTFPRETWEPEGVAQPKLFGFPLAADARRDTNPSIETVQISGPYQVTGPGDTPSRRRILACHPANAAGEEACAVKILSKLAGVAYRRPLTASDVAVLRKFYTDARAQGSFESGIQAGLERILSAPDFLFRIERDPPASVPDTPYRISDVELASRLSFFLWSSIPDQPLLDAAASHRLSNPEVLKQQVRRMLADPRAHALVDNFFGQWLMLRDLRNVLVDPVTFPDFDDGLRQAFERETDLFIESQLREDRSVTDLVSADYTFLNEKLARHYGIPNIYGSRFRRVTLDPDSERGGLFGQGSILTVTSYPTRTSPVLRGKWLLANILGTPVPPPPPNVPALPEKSKSGKPASVRELLEQHRDSAVCAGCHSQMDPLGFALENFDAIGRWRTTSEAGTPLDSSAKLANGTEFNGVRGLRSILMSHREQLARTIAEKLLTYGLGREMEYYDMPAVRGIAQSAAATDYRWSSIIVGIVESAPFQMRRSAGGAAAVQTAGVAESKTNRRSTQ